MVGGRNVIGLKVPLRLAGECTVKSRLKEGEVVVNLHPPPPRPPETMTIRLPNPPGYTITGVTRRDTHLQRDAEGRVWIAPVARGSEFSFAVEPVK